MSGKSNPGGKDIVKQTQILKEQLGKQHQSIEKQQLTEQDLDISNLDLIFQRQPKEIQQKLMKLLISYNAVLQYNAQTDMFQVDLLLPFLNEQQKRHFIKQFLLIRSRHRAQKESVLKDKQGVQSENKPKQVRKFSFNNNYQFKPDQQEYVSRKDKDIDQTKQIDVLNKQIQKQQPFEKESRQIIDSKHAKNNIENIPVTKKKINVEEVGRMLGQRLEKAIDGIKKRKELGALKGNQVLIVKTSEARGQTEDSIIDQMSAFNSFNTTQKFTESQKISMSQHIKQQTAEINQKNPRLFAQSGVQEEYFGSIREEDKEEDDYDPLFKRKPVKEKAISYEQYTKQYASLKQQPKSKKNTKQQPNKSTQISNYNKKTSGVNKQATLTNQKAQSNQFLNKQALNYASQYRSQYRPDKIQASGKKEVNYRSSPSRETAMLHSHLDDFFDSHRLNLDRLYGEIRSNIITQRKIDPPKPEKVRFQIENGSVNGNFGDLILVLDELDSDDNQIDDRSQEQRFKKQMLKDYQKQIVVKNSNLSSEDLVLYFKYLHSNAKKLYLRFMKNKLK